MAGKGHMTFEANAWLLAYRADCAPEDWPAWRDLAIAEWLREKRAGNPRAETFLLALEKS